MRILMLLLLTAPISQLHCQPPGPSSDGHEPWRHARELISTKPDSWRSASVFTHVIWKDLLFYGGSSGSGGYPRSEMEIGIFHMTGPDAGYHDSNNPVISRAQFGLDQPGKGITPLSIFDRGDSLFMFCTSRPDDDLQPHIVLISASVEDPCQWGGYRTIIDHEVSGEENNHGASVILDPDDPSNILLYFAALSNQHEYRILLATAPVEQISSPDAYQIINEFDSAVLHRTDGKTNYPFIRFLEREAMYELWYSGHSLVNPATRSCFRTVSKQKDRFEPASKAVLNASETIGRNDRAYATGPKVNGAYLYYSGRRERRGSYVAIFCVALKYLDPVNK